MRLTGSGHHIEANEFEGYYLSVQLGNWVSAATNNVLRGNLLTTTLGSGTGIWFTPTAQANDSRGNTFGNVGTKYVDQGAGNLY